MDRVLGHLAVAAGDFDAGVGHFEGALAQCRTAGFRAEAVLTRAGLAGALLARAAATEGGDDAEEDDARGLALLADAYREASALGMDPLRRQVEQQRRNAHRPLSMPDGLSSREAEVLRLAARGLSNDEISRALFVSSSTAKNHLSNIYRKIDVNNRAAATRFAIRHGLTEVE